MADESPKTMFLERTAYEAMQWAKEHNIGGDQPSLVFARRFAFLIQLPRSPIMLTAKPISHESKGLELAAADNNHKALVEALEHIAEHPGPNADDAAHMRAEIARDALAAFKLKGAK